MTKIPPIHLIRRQAVTEEIDYNLLSACLQDYSAPRDVITRLLRSGDLIRVKKGLYVFGENYRRRLISLEVLANQIYGPSYLSREYALQYYGLIPEGVNEITSMTTKRNKHFNTPLGQFSYQHLAAQKFCVGVTLIRFSSHHSALIATPEKALADYIYTRKENIVDPSELANVLIEDYRLDEAVLTKIKIELIQNIAKVYQNRTINLLPLAIKEIKNA
jgi:predicted transcriptional regulator of viral defense system